MTARNSRGTINHPAAWVPTLYFAEGLPFYAVNMMALIFFERMGVSNQVITLTVSLLALPWSLKPLWSPLLEVYGTKKFFVVLFELLGGLALGLVAFSLPLPGYFRFSIGFLALVAFISASHDIAADGVYMASLSPKQQAAYAGWQGTFYNAARFFSQGGLIIVAGILESRMPVPHAWMLVFGSGGVLLGLLGLYHAAVLPRIGIEQHVKDMSEAMTTFRDVVVRFFRKPHIWFYLVYILLYRVGEGQVVKVGPLFLTEPRSVGGLGLSTEEFGAIYGTFGTGAMVLGSVLAGYFTSWFSLKRTLLPLVVIMNLPMIAYVYLAVAMPTNLAVITAAMTVEFFGYGIGSIGVILLMMQEIAPGKYQTAHYAFANAFMALSLSISGAASGWIQTRLGYRNFFWWVLISSLPVLLLSRFVPIKGEQNTMAEQ